MILYNIIKDGTVIKVTPRIDYVKWDSTTDHAIIVPEAEATGILIDTTVYNVQGGPSSMPNADTVNVSAISVTDSSGDTNDNYGTLITTLEERLQSLENILIANYRNLIFQDTVSKEPWVDIFVRRIMRGTVNLEDVPSDISVAVLDKLNEQDFNEGGD